MTEQAETPWTDNIVWLRPDGGVSITWCPPGTELEAHRDALASDPDAPYGDYTAVALNAAVPPKDEFRGALTWRDGRLEHDIDRAREIRKTRLRAERVPLLASLDVDYIRADEAGDAAAKARIVEAKRALRDITADPALSQARTLDDLRGVTLPAPNRLL